jgi:hypothetical protein
MICLFSKHAPNDDDAEGTFVFGGGGFLQQNPHDQSMSLDYVLSQRIFVNATLLHFRGAVDASVGGGRNCGV